MKITVLLSLFLAFSLLSKAQYRIMGTVVNGADSKPLQGASIFINGGSNGTLSDAAGNFLLQNVTVANFELVVSYVNYQTIVVKIAPENINKRFRIEMEPKPQELQEVVIGPVLKDGWQTWGKTFTDFFIGTSKNASQCTIKNPKDLRFRYDKKNETLRVTAVDKLIIINNELGLQIDYQLEEFRFQRKASMTTFYGYSSFKNIASKRSKKQQIWINKRREAYNGSLTHFIRAIYNNSTQNEGFEMRHLVRLRKEDSLLRPFYDSIMLGLHTVFDTTTYSMQLMKEGTFAKDPIIYVLGKQLVSCSSIRVYDTASKGWYLLFQNDLQLVYKNEFEKEEYAQQMGQITHARRYQTSILHLPNHRAVLIEKNGLYFDPLDLFSEGYIAWEKMAEMLPIDYQPGD
ncbi:MAG: carboxypeptidase-like regulatory domain-containing protein [Bacteroidota bacterium]|nr:carboxypeptidase-like regulatory domain-containing protein [Bacteroidota bacterium]